MNKRAQIMFSKLCYLVISEGDFLPKCCFINRNTGGEVTVFFGTACEGGLVTEMESFFYPDFREFDFRGIFRLTC